MAGFDRWLTEVKVEDECKNEIIFKIEETLDAFCIVIKAPGSEFYVGIKSLGHLADIADLLNRYTRNHAD